MGVYNQGPRIVELGHLGCRPGPSAIRDHDEFASKSWDLGGCDGSNISTYNWNCTSNSRKMWFVGFYVVALYFMVTISGYDQT